MRGGEHRMIVWDDEAGTVDGDHYSVPRIREWIEAPTPLLVREFAVQVQLQDPAHRPEEFLRLVEIATAADGTPLPPALRDVVPVPMVELPGPPHGSVA